MRSSLTELNEYIFNHFEPKAGNESKTFDRNAFTPSFKQFCQFVVQSGDNFDYDKYSAVSHWMPYYIQCNPCYSGKIFPFIVHRQCPA